MRIEEYPLAICSTGKLTDIVFLEVRGTLKVDLRAAKEIVSSRLTFTENKKHYLIVDVSNIREVSIEAKEYMQHPDGGLKNILGAAFVASNPISALIANIFVKTDKNFDARFFSTKTDAYTWICEYRKEKISQ